MEMRIDVLESKTGTSKRGNAYTIALVRLPAGEGRVGKVFSDVGLEVANDVMVEVALEPNTEMFLSPRIRKVVGE